MHSFWLNSVEQSLCPKAHIHPTPHTGLKLLCYMFIWSFANGLKSDYHYYEPFRNSPTKICWLFSPSEPLPVEALLKIKGFSWLFISSICNLSGKWCTCLVCKAFSSVKSNGNGWSGVRSKQYGKYSYSVQDEIRVYIILWSIVFIGKNNLSYNCSLALYLHLLWKLNNHQLKLCVFNLTCLIMHPLFHKPQLLTLGRKLEFSYIGAYDASHRFWLQTFILISTIEVGPLLPCQAGRIFCLGKKGPTAALMRCCLFWCHADLQCRAQLWKHFQNHYSNLSCELCVSAPGHFSLLSLPA